MRVIITDILEICLMALTSTGNTPPTATVNQQQTSLDSDPRGGSGRGGMFKVERNPAWLSISFLWGLLMSTCSGTLYLYSAYANTFKTHLGFNQTQVILPPLSLTLHPFPIPFHSIPSITH